MRAFLWTVLVVFLVDAAGKIGQLDDGHGIPWRPGMVAADLVLGVVLAVWAVCLLLRDANAKKDADGEHARRVMADLVAAEVERRRARGESVAVQIEGKNWRVGPPEEPAK